MSLSKPTMTKERYRELHRDYSLKLTQEELDEGWWFCICEWDGMLIHESHPEARVCSCSIRGGKS